MLTGVLAALVLAAIWRFGVPWIELTLNTVSTDDAYVKGHVTFVAARVSGQIARVLVDDNNRVHKGDVLAQLDREPYEVAVAEKRAAVETAKADLLAATAAVRGLEAQARSLRWKLQYAMEDVQSTASRSIGCAGGSDAGDRGCTSNTCLFGLGGAADEWGSR